MRQLKKRDIISSIISTINAAGNSDADTICAYWWESRNWGDALNPVLIGLLSGKRPIAFKKHTLNLRHRPVYAVIGSILDSIPRPSIKKTIIWGPGFMQESGRLPGEPEEVRAVRGPLSRENLKRQGIRCPDVYGDPALLYSRFYRPEAPARYLLGIIPHYVDKNSDTLVDYRNMPDVKIIDIEKPINTVIDQICSCKHIASSSLHGLITADAYGIPSTWLKFSGGVAGDGFKFRDYFASVGRADETPLTVSQKTTIDDMIGAMRHGKISINLDELLDNCPFYHRNV